MPAVNPIMAPWIEKMKEDPKIIFVSADSAGGLPDRDWLIQNKRFVSTGIQEANAALVAAGLAEQGFKVY